MSRLLREYIRSILNEAPTLDSSGAPSWAHWFHITPNDHGDEYTWPPRPPMAPFETPEGVIEDNTTKRSSWAPTIELAIDGVGWRNVLRSKKWFIYARPELPGEVDLQDEFEKCDDKIGTKNNPYGTQFSRSKLEDELFFKHAKDPERATPAEIKKVEKMMKQAFKKCVPDAPETGEHWATEPAKGKKIGVYDTFKRSIDWL